MNKLVILWLFVFVSISVAPPPPPPCDGSPIGGECSEEADCCGPAGNQGCEGDKCCGRDKVRCPKGDNDCCDNFHCDHGECKADGSGDCAIIGESCAVAADCCGPEGNQGCEGDTCCGKANVGCPQGDDDCCDGFECDQGECKADGGSGDCATLGESCAEAADCCGPVGNQDCQSDLCCGFAGLRCASTSECCGALECVSELCTVTGGGNAVPFNDNASKWVERDPFMYIYILTWAVFVTFICSVPCAWCYLMDRYGLFQKKEKYGKVVDEHDDL
eukprot:751770_1